MEKKDYVVEYPENDCILDQNEEFIFVCMDTEKEKYRLHDYDRFYEVPGLYEEVVYDHLKCASPEKVCGLLKDEIKNGHRGSNGLRILDFGAGNGIVAETLKEKLDIDIVVGVDIIPEAKTAADRDRPGVYNAYYVMDLANMDDTDKYKLEKWRFNSLVTVAALGYDDIPTHAFLNAFNMLEEGAWVAFNIKDRFLSEEDDSGYGKVLSGMFGESLELKQNEHYCHRMSLAGEPLHYNAIVGIKTSDVTIS